VAAHPRRPGRRAHASRDRRLAAPGAARDEPANAAGGRGGDRISVLVALGAEAGAGASRRGAGRGGAAGADGTGAGGRRLDTGGDRAGPRGARGGGGRRRATGPAAAVTAAGRPRALGYAHSRGVPLLYHRL